MLIFTWLARSGARPDGTAGLSVSATGTVALSVEMLGSAALDVSTDVLIITATTGVQ